jgi:hypothetical protein
MPQGDLVVANQSGAAFRSDVNAQLLALGTLQSGATAPSTTYAYQWWANTDDGLLYIRNGSNTNPWIVVGTLADTNLGLLSLAGGTLTGALLADDSGTAALPAIAFDGDPNTGIFRAGADQFGIATNGVERVEFGTTEVVFNDGGADVDFRIEGDTEPNLFKIDAGLDEVQVANLNGGQLAGTRNRIINGDFSVAQRGTSFVSAANNDDAYTLDRWYILSDGNDAIDVTQETSTVPTNQKYAIALDVETINKKFGIAQIIENVNCVGLTGGNVTLSFKAKVSSTTKLDNVKAAIVAWSGTADTVTSDIISAWGAEGTNPTLIANATYENTPANLNVTTSYASYSLSANIDTASTNNIIVFIWSDVTDTTAGDFLYITDVQLEPGTVATPFERRSYGQELALCERYYQFGKAVIIGFGSVGGYVGSPQNYRTTMRIAAPVTLGTPSENVNFSAITPGTTWPGGFRLVGTIGAGTNINAYYTADYSANSEL